MTCLFHIHIFCISLEILSVKMVWYRWYGSNLTLGGNIWFSYLISIQYIHFALPSNFFVFAGIATAYSIYSIGKELDKWHHSFLWHHKWFYFSKTCASDIKFNIFLLGKMEDEEELRKEEEEKRRKTLMKKRRRLD